jgi:hypothetical protein
MVQINDQKLSLSASRLAVKACLFAHAVTVPVLLCCHAAAELHAAAASPVQRSEGALQRFSSQLLQQVSFKVLQAQVWHRGCCLQLAVLPPQLAGVCSWQ